MGQWSKSYVQHEFRSKQFRISSPLSVQKYWILAFYYRQKPSIFQANDPKIMREFINYMIKVKDNTDSLLESIGSFNLDSYVKSSSEFEAKSQIGGTCYAKTIAAVYHMSIKRIQQREGGHPDFYSIRTSLIDKYSTNAANTDLVIKNTCNSFRLQYKNVDIQNAKQALHQGRPLVATFSLCTKQWDEFFQFFKTKLDGILSLVGPNTQQEIGGHAVVLIAYGENYLKFLNSWGAQWGDQGFFKVKDEKVLNSMKFFDVYWTLNDLLQSEKERFQKNSAKLVQEQTQRYKDIYENIEFTCPKCKKKSPIKSFCGTIYESICPKCSQTFHPQSLGQTFVNYIYGESI